MSDTYNVVDHFVDRHIREGRGRKTAIVSDGRTLSYAEVAEQVGRVGNGAFSGLASSRRQRVLLLLPDSVELRSRLFRNDEDWRSCRSHQHGFARG